MTPEEDFTDIPLDTELMQDILDALDVGNSDGGYGPTIHEVSHAFERPDLDPYHQKQEAGCAVWGWLGRHGLKLVRIVPPDCTASGKE